MAMSARPVLHMFVISTAQSMTYVCT